MSAFRKDKGNFFTIWFLQRSIIYCLARYGEIKFGFQYGWIFRWKNLHFCPTSAVLRNIILIESSSCDTQSPKVHWLMVLSSKVAFQSLSLFSAIIFLWCKIWITQSDIFKVKDSEEQFYLRVTNFKFQISTNFILTIGEK